MRKAINWGIQINKRTVRMIKLERLLRCEVGTGKVESLAERLAMESKGGRVLERVPGGPVGPKEVPRGSHVAIHLDSSVF